MGAENGPEKHLKHRKPKKKETTTNSRTVTLGTANLFDISTTLGDDLSALQRFLVAGSYTFSVLLFILASAMVFVFGFGIANWSSFGWDRLGENVIPFLFWHGALELDWDWT